MTDTPTPGFDLERMRDAAKRATPGPWTREKPPVGDGGFREGCAVAATYGRQTIYANPPGGSFPSFDADHIAASNPANVLALIAAYEEAILDRGEALDALGVSQMSEQELTQATYDLDLQIDDLKHQLDEARAERDALAELLRRAGKFISSVAQMDPDGMGRECCAALIDTAYRVLADIEAKLGSEPDPSPSDQTG